MDFVLALQGTGKSAAAYFLESHSEVNLDPAEVDDTTEVIPRNVLRLKWREPGSLFGHLGEALMRGLDNRFQFKLSKEYQSRLAAHLWSLSLDNLAYQRGLKGRVLEVVVDGLTKERRPTVTLWDALDGKEVKQQLPDLLEAALGLLPKSKKEEAEQKVLPEVIVFGDVDALVIDMSDYKRKDARLITSDLSELSGFWQTLKSQGWRGHLVVFLQKELYGGHFFEGKGFRFEITPFTAEELATYYRELFDGPYPFTEEALSLVARLSRGVFRRFKRYALLCVEDWEATESANRGVNIDARLVREAVTEAELTKDLELELSELFPREGSARIAARAISVAAKSVEPVNQKTLAETLGVSQDVIGRVLETLEANGYVIRENAANGKVVRLA